MCNDLKYEAVIAKPNREEVLLAERNELQRWIFCLKIFDFNEKR